MHPAGVFTSTAGWTILTSREQLKQPTTEENKSVCVSCKKIYVPIQ